MHFWVLSAIISIAVGQADSAVVAKVNGEVITDKDLLLQRESMEREAASPDKALDRLVLFRLAIQQAKKEKLDETPETQREVNKTIYRAYLDKELKKAGQTLSATPEELKAAYDLAPLFTIRHLVLLNRSPEEKKKAADKLHQIQEDLKGGEDFKKLVIKYSDDPMGRQGGEIEFRGQHNLPPEIYAAAKTAKLNKVSEMIRLENSFHMIQVLKKSPLETIPATYSEFLRQRIQKEKSEKFLAELLLKLKRQAHIEYIDK